jgi:hypothetical protein
MYVPQYARLDNGIPTPLSRDQIEPIVHDAMVRYFDALTDEYGEYLMSPEEGTEKSLREHNILLINDDYLLGYVLGSEWYAKGLVLSEEYLIRVGKGKTTLTEVFDTMKALALIHGARECHVGTRASKNQKAIRKLYERHGLQETMTVMRC